MVRIKFTGPSTTVRLQPAQAQKTVSNGTSSAQAQQQILLQRPQEQTIQESIALKQQQSLELVQVMLHVSFGTLFYLREFLPLPCFEDRDLKAAQKEHKLSYQEFIDQTSESVSIGSNSVIPFGSGKRGQPLKVIVRHADPKADIVLDVLENGIFDALRKNVLEAIQLTILADKEKPENVLESYTFSFKYSGKPGDVNTRLESLSMDPVGCVADIKSAQTARVGLETIVRRLITLSAFLPTLPNKRNLGIHLFYTNDCPPNYEPPGFITAKDETIKYPLDNNWRKESQSCGTMNSGWHTVGLKVTSLKWIGPEPEGSEAPPRIPDQLEYKEVARREDDIGFSDGTELLQREEKCDRNDKASNGCLDPPSETSQGTETLQETSQDIRNREELERMLPENSPMNPDLNPTQPINHSMDLGGYSGQSTPTGKKFVLNEKQVTDIREHLRSRKTSVLNNAEQEGHKVIKCQCGWNGEEAEMIGCRFCHTRQHALCYGFKHASDPRVPDIHACYQCLLEPKEPHLLSEMNSLVLLRRALKIILDEGYPSKTSVFTQKLHCNGQTVVQITDVLKKERIILPTQGYKAKGFIRKGLPKYSIFPSDDVYQRMDRDIFDPMLKIKHYYTEPTSDSGSEYPRVTVTYEHGHFHKPTSDSTPSVDDSRREDSTTPPNHMIGIKERIETRKRKDSPGNDDTEGHEADLDRSLQKSAADGSRTWNERVSAHPDPGRGDTKRRKISNYSEPIDVGADTSDNESMEL